MTTLTRTLANQEIPGSRYDPERDLDTIASGDTDYHEPSCHCMFCRDWEFWRNAPSEDHPVVP